MPRVGEQLADDLRALSESLGNPGAEALYTAAKRRKLAVSKKQVQEFVKAKSEKQVLGAPQRAAGKTISEDNNRWQMDLIDVSQVPAGSWKFFLVVVNVFDRYLYARRLKTKDGPEVAKELEAILAEATSGGRKKPQIISSDNGSEFTNPDVKKLLDKRGIVQKFKEVGDLNALGLLDRQIGLLKRRLAEMQTTNGKSWAVNLPTAVVGLNKTPKPGVLYGATPGEVREDPEVQFMLMQDQARAIEHNQKITDKKTKDLRDAGTFRPQVTLNKFKRNFQATYGDPQKVSRIENGRVYSTSGQDYPVKQVRVVPVSAQVVGNRTAEERKMANGGTIILDALERLLAGHEQMSLSKAAIELRGVFINDGRDYPATMRKVGGQLIDLIRLVPERFKLVQQPHGTKMWYYVALA
jgi:transposase InsO family protein